MTTQNSPDSSSGTDTDVLAPEGEIIETNSQDELEQVESSATDATAGAKPANLLDLVRNVVADTQTETPPVEVKPAEEKASQTPESTEKPGTPPPSGEQESKDEAKPEDDEKLPFHKHPRWQAVIKERDAFRVTAEASRDKATQFDAISDYMTESNLTPEEVNQGFIIMAAIRNDPAKALRMLTDTVGNLRKITGDELPEEVSKLVDDGEMSEAAARDLSRTRAELARQQSRHQEEASHRQRQSQADSHQQIIGAVEGWEQQIATRDPDYQAKRSLVLQNIRLANLESPAANAREALAIAEAAYAKATETVRSFQPKRVATREPASTQSLPRAKADPKNLLDVVRGALV